MSLEDLLQRRLIIVTGKGGVGKTTLAAALARRYARKGKRVLAAEIVPLAETHSQLGDALGGPKPLEEPVLVDHNLWAALLTPSKGHLRFLQDTLPIRLLAEAAMRSQGLRKFLAAAPGFSDMGIMYRMLDLMNRKKPGGGDAYEICIVDSPATGHALALAQIPEFLIRLIPAGPIYRAAKAGVDILTDPQVTTTVVVTLPETLPITESLELKHGLEKHHLPVAALVVNRVPKDPFSAAERQALAGVLSAGGSAVLGARELRRIERAETALALLRSREDAGSWVVLSEVEGVGTETSQRLEAQL